MIAVVPYTRVVSMGPCENELQCLSMNRIHYNPLIMGVASRNSPGSTLTSFSLMIIDALCEKIIDTIT